MEVNKISSVLLLAIAVASSCCPNVEDEAIERLEGVIRLKSTYEQEFKDRTDGLRDKLYTCCDPDKRWDTARELHKEYLSYDIDSAFVYSDLMKSMVDSPDREVIALEADISCLCALRMYSKATELLNSIDTTSFNDIQKKAFYGAHVTLYTSLGNEPDADKGYEVKRHHYQGLLSELPNISERDRKYLKCKQLMLEKNYAEALDGLYVVLDMEEDVASRLHTTYAIANCYNALGDEGNYKKWLAETAIFDIQRPNKQYRSIYDLALTLYEDGDVRRAGEFIHITVMDAIACKHDTRIINAVSAQTIINAKAEADAQSRRWLWAALISVLIITIVCISMSLAKVNRQRKRLKTLMKRTKELNIELSKKNNIITEANLIKEQYMFKYMYLSANFIKEMEEYRKGLLHTHKEKGHEALFSKLREPEYIYMQYKSFYKLFDEIFLGIFPDFLKKVNRLLKEDKQIELKHEGTMPTELRILAVIRLGITESRRIAEFLNTSVNTVYTYRTKLRYNSICGADSFEEQVKEINCF